MSIYSTFEYFDTLLSHPDIFEIARKDPRYLQEIQNWDFQGYLSL